MNQSKKQRHEVSFIQKHIFDTSTQVNYMNSVLIVKNFGPIKDVKLNLKNVNVFIGQQASGKSALAKIYTIFKAPRKFFTKTEKSVELDNERARNINDIFKEYNIGSFLNAKTEIEFESELHNISYKNLNLDYVPKLLDKLNNLEVLSKNFDNYRDVLVSSFKHLADKFIYFRISSSRILEKNEDVRKLLNDSIFDNLNKENFQGVLEIIKAIEIDLSTNTASYIPAERNFINIIQKSALNLILNDVPIPKHILTFGAELEKLNAKEINLDFIQKDLKFKNIDGEEKIFINNDQSIKLTEAASGIQSVVPILATIFNKNSIYHRSFVIEEPELNLFPIAQYELIQILESNRTEAYWEDYGTIHTYTTHSPFILSALNNLLYAYKVAFDMTPYSKDFTKEKAENEKKIRKIVKASINPDSFAAYQICDGKATSIFNAQTGLIEDNYIDEASDKINDDFEQLMELSK